jgi:hypothetical protein
VAADVCFLRWRRRRTSRCIWRSRAIAVLEPDAVARASRCPDLQTPLGSLWKLFVYAWLVDTGAREPAYECRGQSKEEVYCCTAGGKIERDQALVKSCGLYFEPARWAFPAPIGEPIGRRDRRRNGCWIYRRCSPPPGSRWLSC